MTINLQDFFSYYEGTPEQKEAIAMLQQQMPHTLMQDDSAWVVQYRKQPEPPAETAPSSNFRRCTDWPVSKEQMGQIMGCSPDSLPDSLMEDYARCVETFGMSRLAQVYFLGQCGHESAGLRYPMEIHDGSNYENRTDLGNTRPGDGVKFAGTGWIQVTGRHNHQAFADYMASIGQPDPKIMGIGKTYSSEKYPWTISGNWWRCNNMNAFCDERKECTNYQIDEVGRRVNGQMRPRGADERIKYTDTAYRVLIGV